MNKKTVAIVAACLVLIFVAVIVVQIKTTQAVGPCDSWTLIKACYRPNPPACCSYVEPKGDVSFPH